jgi:hypothetical protein
MNWLKSKLVWISLAVIGGGGLIVGSAHCELATTKEDYVACTKGLSTNQKEIVRESYTSKILTISPARTAQTREDVLTTMYKLGDKFEDCAYDGAKISCAEPNVLKRIEKLSNEIHAKKRIR